MVAAIATGSEVVAATEAVEVAEEALEELEMLRSQLYLVLTYSQVVMSVFGLTDCQEVARRKCDADGQK